MDRGAGAIGDFIRQRKYTTWRRPIRAATLLVMPGNAMLIGEGAR
jgi:hypothetical protein